MARTEQRAKGAGPFTTRLTWHLPDGGTAVWESRPARRRGTLAVRPPGSAGMRHTRAGDVALRRPRGLNTTAPTACASVYFAGGLFFNTSSSPAPWCSPSTCWTPSCKG